jgi:hypothetical protein
VRAVGLDVHLDFCEVAVVEDGEVRSVGRIDTKPEGEVAYARTVRDWHATQAKKAGASATLGRASVGPRRAKSRGRPQAPDVCSSLRQSLAPRTTLPQEPPLSNST